MLCLQYGMLNWCGLVDVRRAPIATEFCVAEKFREVPRYDMAKILHYIFCTEKALSDQRAFSARTETP
jgi:hypothetical protein